VTEEPEHSPTEPTVSPVPDEQVPDEAEPRISVLDPRALLANWANKNDEWVRLIVGEVIQSGKALSDEQIAQAYRLFRQEKGLDDRTLDKVEDLSTDAAIDEVAPRVEITKISDVHGVNALVPGSVIEPHSGLTIIYGENGTGKTGYSRIFKALAQSRTDSPILGDINAETAESASARIDHKVGTDDRVLQWQGEHGVSPFTRMAIFDSPCVTYHVDDALEYVYVPAALALFQHAGTAIRSVQTLIDEQISKLSGGSSTLLSRFPRESSVYTEIETLGATTNLDELKAKVDSAPEPDKRIEVLETAVSALKSGSISSQLALRQREKRVFEQALQTTTGLLAFDTARYNDQLAKRIQLSSDLENFRTGLFEAADLPAEPEESWTAFIEAGEAYRQHLVSEGAHDEERCLYCRQALDPAARDLVSRYSAYLEDKISADLRGINQALRALSETVRDLARPDIDSFIEEHKDGEEKPSQFETLRLISQAQKDLYGVFKIPAAWNGDLPASLTAPTEELSSAITSITTLVDEFQAQVSNQADTLKAKQAELDELKAAVELGRSWAAIEAQVTNAKEAYRLTQLKSRFSSLSRGVTELSKEASDQLINQNFDHLFTEECDALRAPSLKVQFVGRQGKPQRRKILTVDQKPSLVLSEGEQKVLAIADFLAEATLAGITAPVIFDDPVSSLDHRRIREVAERIALLAQDNQVIVFTHDILFATTLHGLTAASNQFAYFEITDNNGKGQVTRGTHPTADSIKSITADINSNIQAAKAQDGATRTALVRQAYSRLRAFCEVFAEKELLQGVSTRYDPAIHMTMLAKIKLDKLPDAISVVNEVFDTACRHTEAHSQPVATLGVAPTLEELEADWTKIKDARKQYLA
jgi:hypothetical protein